MIRNFMLEKGIYCDGFNDNFKLYYGKIPLTENCQMITYIPKALIAVKSNDTIYVYQPLVKFTNEEVYLSKIAIFKAFDKNSYIRVKIKDNIYYIDSNAQIRYKTLKNHLT